MADAVAFNPAAWKLRYPEFQAVPDVTAAMYFAEAGMYWRNDGTSPNKNNGSQLVLMNMLTAHIAALYSQAQGSANPGSASDPNTPVGRISNAGVGSVNVATDLGITPGTSAWKAWLQQTKYGLSFLSATGPYRSSYYVPGALQPGGLGWPASPGGRGTFFKR